MTAGVTAYGGARYYRHSGKVPAGALVISLLTAVMGGGLVGAVYGAVGFWGHLIPIDKLFVIVEIGATLGTAALLGLMSVVLYKGSKGRSTPIAAAFVLLTVGVAYYTSWVFWAYAYARYSQVHVTAWELADPRMLWDFIRQFNENGIWYFGKSVAKQALLTLIWVTEAGIFLVLPVYLAWNQMKLNVFCEHCGKWGTTRHLTAIRAENLGDLQVALEAGRMEALAQASPKRVTDTHWAVVDLEGCGSCDTLQTLNLASCTETRTKEGKAVIKVKKLIHRMMLTPEQTVELAMIAAGKGEGAGAVGVGETEESPGEGVEGVSKDAQQGET